jgi:hypothetical protein
VFPALSGGFVSTSKWVCRDLLPGLVGNGEPSEKLQVMSGILGVPFAAVEEAPEGLAPDEFSSN